jgi:glutamate synthase domain-containing protein 2
MQIQVTQGDIYTNMDLDFFCEWLKTLTPDQIVKVELVCYRADKPIRAKYAEAAGVANCGVEYWGY